MSYVITGIVCILGTLLAEYLIVKNNEAYLLRKYAEALIRIKNLKSNIADVENTINQAIASLK